MSVILNTDILESLEELMGDNFQELLVMFYRDSKRYADNILQGFEEGDAQIVVDGAHSLKASAANIGMELLASHSGRIENAALLIVNEGQGQLADINAEIKELQQIYERSIEALRATVKA